MPQSQPLHSHSGFARRRGPSDELRRAFEHLARIDVLEGALAGQAFCDVSTLVALALNELHAGNDHAAAELLTAAEHLCFAAQSPQGYSSSTMRVFAELRHALDAEFDTLVRRADVLRAQSTSPRHGTLSDLCTRTLKLAREAHREQSFGRAIELARAGELLADIAARACSEEAERIAS